MPRQGESWGLKELVLVPTVFLGASSFLISYLAVELWALIISLFHHNISFLGSNLLKHQGNGGSRPYDGLSAVH